MKTTTDPLPAGDCYGNDAAVEANWAADAFAFAERHLLLLATASSPAEVKLTPYVVAFVSFLSFSLAWFAPRSTACVGLCVCVCLRAWTWEGEAVLEAEPVALRRLASSAAAPAFRLLLGGGGADSRVGVVAGPPARWTTDAAPPPFRAPYSSCGKRRLSHLVNPSWAPRSSSCPFFSRLGATGLVPSVTSPRLPRHLLSSSSLPPPIPTGTTQASAPPSAPPSPPWT